MTKPLSRRHHKIDADALVFIFFPPVPSYSLKLVKQHRSGAHRAQPGQVCDLHQVLEMVPVRLIQLRSATFSKRKRAYKSSLCVYTPVMGPNHCLAVSGQLIQMCAAKAQGAMG